MIAASPVAAVAVVGALTLAVWGLVAVVALLIDRTHQEDQP